MSKASVIIPAYNKAEYTRRTVESVLVQDYRDIEVLVVDDGSKDNTSEVMEQFAGRIRYLRKDNGGACSARNYGIKHAAGKYLAFLDCDDLYAPSKVRQCIEYLERNGRFGFVYTDAEFIDADDRVVGRYSHPASCEGNIASSLILGNFICNSTVLARRDVLEKAGVFDETIFTPGDWDLWLRLSQTAQAGYIPQPLTRYRVTDNYIFNRLDQACREEQYVLEKFFKGGTGGVLRRRAYSNYHMRFAQCFFLKDDRKRCWEHCRRSLMDFPLNFKTWAMAAAAVAAPALLRKELEKRILRKGDA